MRRAGPAAAAERARRDELRLKNLRNRWHRSGMWLFVKTVGSHGAFVHWRNGILTHGHVGMRRGSLKGNHQLDGLEGSFPHSLLRVVSESAGAVPVLLEKSDGSW